ncbi:hypothetical protein INS49_000599 [Diaporthe citri]|uniref:uncharacterized protein n=1 Tax=Diaporthe citri TaxID=83186 RepID=UPI001C7F03E5|nr:uncharacterized protein INS49_000599 [Diaporthe citri]KAG6366422.1 hypothetical protein INS49_000599 [Diaporthe citri]
MQISGGAIHSPVFKMNQQDLKNVPFTEDPTQKELTAYATFTESSYTSKFCDHFRKNESVYVVEDETSKDKEVQRANKIHVVEEDAEEGEGPIERKDLYTVCHSVLGKDGQNLRVFQFGTLGLEIHPERKGIIRLGTWDVELILKTCINYKEGKNIMKKVSGSAISDEKIRFRWCLRGPTIDRATDAEPIHKRAVNKWKSLFNK